ncbi:MAG: [FeFe] hydrogenase H-cluster radical SAM maturase HydG [Bacteroidetes bacterium]|nr:MAG: [FeFe] hydrogenase H-cluster radical SAM maturase HydG [Bacteroidota bacterium]
MQFTPERYAIPDRPMEPFIDPQEIHTLLNEANTDPAYVRGVIAKSLDKNRLNLAETASLLQTSDPQLVEEILEGARTLKRRVYGQRIVLFAPLYIGNKCKNDCTYCGFRAPNLEAIRTTLTERQLKEQIEALEQQGQKRLILVYGEHAAYTPEFIARTVEIAYQTKVGNGEIRRVNINAAPLSIEGFRTVRDAGIGTYQIFQETYHPEAYRRYHLSGPKADFNYRLTALDRAQEAGLDDVGIGALFGLYDWRYEAMALVRHTNHLEACYNVGPHTISFPRIQEASDVKPPEEYALHDDDFLRMVAVLRLAVPYTGMILTAREPISVRDRVLEFGISQIDGGTKLEIGAYSQDEDAQDLDREQFRINDERQLAAIIDDLLDHNHVPSFCTACYRLGRTGEHFMEFSVPGFIKRYCTPNAILTLSEYLHDYADADLRAKGDRAIARLLEEMPQDKHRRQLADRLERIARGERDLYF